MPLKGQNKQTKMQKTVNIYYLLWKLYSLESEEFNSSFFWIAICICQEIVRAQILSRTQLFTFYFSVSIFDLKSKMRLFFVMSVVTQNFMIHNFQLKKTDKHSKGS